MENINSIIPNDIPQPAEVTPTSTGAVLLEQSMPTNTSISIDHETVEIHQAEKACQTANANIALMQPAEAAKILQKLIEGINPLSDEPLAQKHLYRDDDIQRALQAATFALERQIKTHKRQVALPANAGKPWVADEERQLITGFEQGHSIDTLAEQHQRTKGSITSRLVKLGKIDP